MSEPVRATEPHTTETNRDRREPAAELPHVADESIPVGRLLRRLVEDVTVLVRKEVALATTEVSNSIDRARASIGSIAGGGAVLFAGFLFLLLSATFALALVVPAWAAALIVGAAACLLGLVMYLGGQNRLKAGFVPDRATRSMRKDADMIERHTHGHTHE